MPKTASKSCSAAMEMLGYKVADIVETATLLLDVWLAYYDGKATIEGKGLFCTSLTECGDLELINPYLRRYK